MSAFGTYLIGFIILIIGLALAAFLLNVPPLWILAGVIVLIGLGVLLATSRTKPLDPPIEVRHRTVETHDVPRDPAEPPPPPRRDTHDRSL